MNKPDFVKVFPSKKLINRILFQLDSDITSRTIIPIYRSLYEKKTIPTKYRHNGEVLFLMNRVLSKINKISHYETTPLKEMRNSLLYKSANNGSNDAIALLCFEVLSNKDVTPTKKKEAEKLLRDLIMLGHGLSFKVVGDLYHSMGKTTECISWYEKFLEQPQLKNELKGEVLEKIAEIQYKEDSKNIKIAERNFLEVIKICKLQDCVKSYFYLAQIYIKYDPMKSKILLEQCCTQGFKEAFKELGYLEMNYFRDYGKAQEWFKIGMEVFEFECYFGYFDCSFELKQYNNCINCLKSMEILSKVDKNYKQYIKMFIANRTEKIQISIKNSKSENKPLANENGINPINTNVSGVEQSNSRW
ncbi:similar to Saccharomyces cerevisiae YDL107W MSS2 Peripherally bound inner membrane protein of the mitochondrial matrix involved in membrane insertion of C-terminus of Cox2p [Maudiozyma barnettii]|uniref:Similar to Saccharomyces cerevisiae YDL107W MSS2 Peripherally bound inner membrane protein of the mitochondrial matrix involved in membrane insertion of C-terminus of Cox2p n=1 Tax=Maudiozyma barnettii TaxID=61262 RepID=A0A8H2VKP8_9SACH|nr:Mss2p [Kazachstania barnettii]CAB4257070.1 similar to Saccharomyces cerevisiae YDL107W MSS2 Peripherally bound inner membrane protein of the mitochondrial matrix involved in membrane insertion of C-terminus of Cox2p [Kazachstania barnettii]CAD1779441.1 similar to Saccharomyces cerevisiae YDL107W MSS2 Peripherally bound inner membrane protein of the mitochondrial matrix involved in membrane insertion of C-terminus of Cox2p [Kazachstania barnettii]